jgi:GDP-4-dehydro-6-deoxy-D-mannose reductase
VISDFAKQISEIKIGKREPVLMVGDIDVTRDFTDVRDMVRAYRMLLNDGKNGEIYNVCSRKEFSIRGLLSQMLDIAGVDARIEQEKERLRPSEQRRVFGSYEKLHNETGWRPNIPIEQTLADILEYWRRKIDE